MFAQVKSDCLRVLGLNLFHMVPKTVHLEDFVSLQNQARNETVTKLGRRYIFETVTAVEECSQLGTNQSSRSSFV